VMSQVLFGHLKACTLCSLKRILETQNPTVGG